MNTLPSTNRCRTPSPRRKAPLQTMTQYKAPPIRKIHPILQTLPHSPNSVKATPRSAHPCISKLLVADGWRGPPYSSTTKIPTLAPTHPRSAHCPPEGKAAYNFGMHPAHENTVEITKLFVVLREKPSCTGCPTGEVPDSGMPTQALRPSNSQCQQVRHPDSNRSTSGSHASSLRTVLAVRFWAGCG